MIGVTAVNFDALEVRTVAEGSTIVMKVGTRCLECRWFGMVWDGLGFHGISLGIFIWNSRASIYPRWSHIPVVIGGGLARPGSECEFEEDAVTLARSENNLRSHCVLGRLWTETLKSL